MSATVRILGRANCGACIFTKRAFELARISVEVVDVDEDETAAATVRRVAGDTGRMQLPVVVCEDGTTWSGLRLDRIADLVRAA